MTASLITWARGPDGVDIDMQGGLKLLTNREAAATVVRDTFLLREGSSLYGDRAGFPFDEMLGVVNPLLFQSLVREHLQRIPIVDSVDTLTATNNEATRSVTVSFSVSTTLDASVTLTFDA